MKKLPIQDRSRATVAAILEATAQLLQSTTPEGLTTAQIAERAGVSVGSIYQYFESKESVIVALATDTVARLNSEVQRTLAKFDPDDIASAIPPIVDALLRSHEKEPERIGFLIEHLASRGNLGAVDQSALALEVWLAGFFAELNYAPPEVSAIRVRIAVHGVSAVLRTTMRNSPADMRSPLFRHELIRFLQGLLAVPDEETER